MKNEGFSTIFIQYSFICNSIIYTYISSTKIMKIVMSKFTHLHCPPKVPSHTVFQKLFSFSYLKQKLNVISIDLFYTLHPHFNLPINKQYQK